MRFNALVIAGGAAQAFPVIAGVVARRRLSPGRRWIVAWGVYSVVGQTIDLLTGNHGRNLWWSYIAAPIDGSLLLMALSCWQERWLWRRSIRWAIVVALALHVLSVSFLEQWNGFSIASVPIYSLLALGAALVTLVSRALGTTEPPWRQDWFWIAGGIAVYDAAYAVITPVGAALTAQQALAALFLVYQVFQVVNIVGYAMVAVGVLCPASSPAPVATSS